MIIIIIIIIESKGEDNKKPHLQIKLYINI